MFLILTSTKLPVDQKALVSEVRVYNTSDATKKKKGPEIFFYKLSSANRNQSKYYKWAWNQLALMFSHVKIVWMNKVYTSPNSLKKQKTSCISSAWFYICQNTTLYVTLIVNLNLSCYKKTLPPTMCYLDGNLLGEGRVMQSLSC